MASPPGGSLGDLERAVLELLWQQGPADVKEAHRQVGVRRKITPNTVQSTMERLFRKGLLLREKVSHAYVYRPAVSREEYGRGLVESILEDVLAGDAEPLLSTFVDLTARQGEASLSRLEQLIAERRRKGGEP